MTRKEARTFLSGTKVYVEGKSKEIQEKLFSLGYDWIDKRKQVQYEEKPFLFIRKDLLISHSEDVVYFKKESTERELSADEILSIEVTEPYRPFKSQEECWNEMLKHQPFGWLRNNDTQRLCNIGSIGRNNCGVVIDKSILYFDLAFNTCNFVDGAPFGIKEE